MTDENSGLDAAARRRQLARSNAQRRVGALDEAVAELHEDLTALAVPAHIADTLLAGARALVPVASRAGVELQLSVSPDGWIVRVRGDRALLEARPHSDVPGQLADLLRGDGGAPR